MGLFCPLRYFLIKNMQSLIGDQKLKTKKRMSGGDCEDFNFVTSYLKVPLERTFFSALFLPRFCEKYQIPNSEVTGYYGANLCLITVIPKMSSQKTSFKENLKVHSPMLAKKMAKKPCFFLVFFFKTSLCFLFYLR